MYYSLIRTPNEKHKYEVHFQDGRKVKFGDNRYEDYLMHQDVKRKRLYILRHKSMNKDWTRRGIYTPGFWSRYLTWNKPTLEESIENIRKKFGLKLI